MENTSITSISVRTLVEFVLLSGNISSGFTSAQRMMEGIRGHQTVQKSRPEAYSSEVPVKYTLERDSTTIEITGRIDGILRWEKEVMVEEIKTTWLDLNEIERDTNPLHWAQAKCYGFMYAAIHGLEGVSVQLTYFHLETENIRIFNEYFSFFELKEFFENLLDQYIQWAVIQKKWCDLRDTSIKALPFPFQQYRIGQRELAVSTYKTIRDGGKLFVQAPTGIGKTMATLFPAIKALGEGNGTKIFYLTAKTITRTIAEKALDKMREAGLKCKSITITAKDKICFRSDLSQCDPEQCQYALGYYDRLKEAMGDIFHHDAITKQLIEEYARKHGICPFEFTLDLTLWADCIICDYNYAFDPKVYLKRFFMEVKEDYIFLIDEAHNLVDRSREMFSASIHKECFLKLKKEVKKQIPKLSSCLTKINRSFIDVRKECALEPQEALIHKEKPLPLIKELKKFVGIAEEWVHRKEPFQFRDQLLEVYFDTLSFLQAGEVYDERFITYFEKIHQDVKVKLFCLDPSFLLSEAMNRGKSSILFSATLTPLPYFMRILGGGLDSRSLMLHSPFPRENLCLLLDHQISTRYKNREYSYQKIAESIQTVIEQKVGNYLIFFPSYKYMQEVYEVFCSIGGDVRIMAQKEGMSEEEKEEFLSEFTEDREVTLVGFVVMGGVFGEGIDLSGDRLSGAVIVGVGLPQISMEREIIREYFSHIDRKGYEFAYMYPGMNKVLQAAGRVIRTERDRGVVLLIDERFYNSSYRNLYPKEWKHLKTVKNHPELKERIHEFWQQ